MSYEYYEHDEEEEELEQDIFDDTSMFRVKPSEIFLGQKKTWHNLCWMGNCRWMTDVGTKYNKDGPLLAPTGALIVMMCYYISRRPHFEILSIYAFLSCFVLLFRGTQECLQTLSWSIGPLVHWSIVSLVHWSIGLMVHRSIGPSVHWSIGLLVKLNVKCKMSFVICKMSNVKSQMSKFKCQMVFGKGQ